jgi:hypothetical protein
MQKLIGLCVFSVMAAACGSDDIDSDEEARRAYLGLDLSVEKSLQMGFDAFNAETGNGANIDPQNATGLTDGTLTITGQVDNGASDNKGMRLHVGMAGYSDGDIEINDDGDTIKVLYDTDVNTMNQPFLDCMFRNFPGGTLEGTLIGTYVMSGDIESEATLMLTISGATMDGGNGTVVRVPGGTTITGTLDTSDDGTFEVNITL